MKNKGWIEFRNKAIVFSLVLIALVANEAVAQVSPRPRVPTPAADLTSLLYKPSRLVYRQTEGEGFRKPTGVFVDRESGEVVVADSGSNLVTVLSRDGVPLYSIGYNGEIPQPSQAVVDKKGRILVLAGVPRKVKVFTYRGEPLGDFDYPGFDGGSSALPTALTVDQAGNIYVADSTSSRILVYNLDGRLVGTVGKPGDGPGGFRTVTGMAVDSEGTLYVADAQHKPSIQVFDAQGNYLRGWGEHSGGPQNFSLPSGIGLDSVGRVLVLDTIRQSITVFTTEGKYLFRFGGLGAAPGSLAYPTGLDADSAGRLYVTESVNARLQVFELATPTARTRTSARPEPAVPSSVLEEMRRGLGEALKGMGK